MQCDLIYFFVCYFVSFLFSFWVAIVTGLFHTRDQSTCGYNGCVFGVLIIKLLLLLLNVSIVRVMVVLLLLWLEEFWLLLLLLFLFYHHIQMVLGVTICLYSLWQHRE